MDKKTPTALLILDGWGQAPESPGNAVSLANTPTLDWLLQQPSRTLLACSGREVGLPVGCMGNSEVGHLNIGAGRVVFQDCTRIDSAIEDGSFQRNHVLCHLLAGVAERKGTLHLLGLFSDGGVHSHLNHLSALLAMADQAQVPVAIHAFMDGRDTHPAAGLQFIQKFFPNQFKTTCLASLCGRFYAMDRDSHWERIETVWKALVEGQADCSPSAVRVLENHYRQGLSDEFVRPTLIVQADGEPRTIKNGDAVFFFNFRADRARQLCRAFADQNFSGFQRTNHPSLSLASMTEYDASFALPYAFQRQDIQETLGETLALAGMKQVRIAETEKYAHVSYFFNGGIELPFCGEDRCIVPSPRAVATYEQCPEMSAGKVLDAFLEAWGREHYDFLVCNFANLDMLGHTGNIPAVVKACEIVDDCVARIIKTVVKTNGRLVITADHGNAEEMLDADGAIQTAHSKNPVAFVVLDDGPVKKFRSGGKLADIAPTLLHFWGMPKPEVMTGESLWEEI